MVSVHYPSKMLVNVRTELNKNLIEVHIRLHWNATRTPGEITCHKQNNVMKTDGIEREIRKGKQETMPGRYDEAGSVNLN